MCRYCLITVEDTMNGEHPIYGAVVGTGGKEVSGSWYGASAKVEHTKKPGDVGEIVESWLREHGYDGLCGDGCGCIIGELYLCTMDGSIPADCVPAYSNPKRAKEGGCSFWMQPEKPGEEP